MARRVTAAWAFGGHHFFRGNWDCRERPPGVTKPGVRLSPDCQRSADLHQPRQADDVGVAHADAAMRDPSGEKLRLVGPVDPDHSSAGPVGEYAGARARAERDRTVERRVELRELLADVELAARGRPHGAADADD